MNEKKMESLEHFHQLVEHLKRANKRLCSNCFLGDPILQSYIQQEALWYTYVPDEHMNIWFQERDFARLFYYIANLDTYRVPDIKEIIVCDQICSKKTEQTEAANQALKRAGLKQYAHYHKWRKIDAGVPIVDDGTFTIQKGTVAGYFELLEKHFDVYSDLLPEQKDADEYFSNRICYSALQHDSNRLLGGLVVSKKGKVYTEDFVFVDTSYRKMGIAAKLHECWYMDSEHDAIFEAWIRDDNLASQKLHLQMGYQEQQAYKTTMMKG